MVWSRATLRASPEATLRASLRARTQEARRILLWQGERRLGPPAAETVAAIEQIAEVERLEDLIDRVAEVASWEELLATPPDTE